MSAFPISKRDKAWRVDARTKEGGSRKFFPTKGEADTFAQQCRAERNNNGIVGFGSAELAQYGKTVHDAVAFYLAHLRQLASSRLVKDIVPDFLAEKKADNISKRHLKGMRIELKRFTEVFGERMICSLTAAEITEWLDGLGGEAVTRNSIRCRISPLFSFAKVKKWLWENPFAGGKDSEVRIVDEPRKKVKILTNARVQSLLDAASDETLPFWLIAIFAGLRPESELFRLVWADIDLEQAVIVVDGEASEVEETKTGRRVVKMAKNLVAALRPFADCSGPVAPKADIWKKLRKDKRRVGFGAPATEIEEEIAQGIKLEPWPADVARHTYGSNHLARFGDIGVTATQMGNSPEIVRQRYLALVKPAAAEIFWNILPQPRPHLLKLPAAAPALAP